MPTNEGVNMSDLVRLGIRELSALDLGVLVKLLADGSLNHTSHVLYSIAGHTKSMGHSRPVLRAALDRLGKAGYIDVDGITGEKGVRTTTTIRLLRGDEVKAKVAAAGYSDSIVEIEDSL